MTHPHRPGRLSAALRAAAALALACPTAVAAAPGCSSVSATGIAFGAYDPLGGAPLDVAGSLAWKCTGASSIVVTLSSGAAGSFSPRALVRAGESLAYNVYLDAARTTVFGDGTGGSSTLVLAGGGPQSTPVYGRVFAGQDVSAGTYSDVLTLTFNF